MDDGLVVVCNALICMGVAGLVFVFVYGLIHRVQAEQRGERRYYDAEEERRRFRPITADGR
ncbi:MAG: hypothetical protein Kow00124_31670 [Anaerolineae bacterium]